MMPLTTDSEKSRCRDHLRVQLDQLQELLNSPRPHLESEENQSLVQSVNKRLDSLENETSLASTWSYGKMLVAAVSNAKITGALDQQRISTGLIMSLDWKDTVTRDESIAMLNLILATGHLYLFYGTLRTKSQDCLFLVFLRKCFNFMKEERDCHFYNYMVQKSGPPTLLYLCELKGHQNISNLHQILDEMFQQLVGACFATKSAVEAVLKSCGWKIAEPIREMLNSTLINCKSAPHLSCQNVYQIVLELVKTDKDLVIGLINNTELCLSNGRNDRLIGLQFFCDLFGSTVKEGLPNFCNFFSHLWKEFQQHCKNNSLHEPKELLLIASHTGALLKQPSAHQDWCNLLFDLFQYVLAPRCEIEFIIGITEALYDNPSLVNRDHPKSLIFLVKEFLTPASTYECFGKARDLLLKNLGKLYMKQAMAGANDMTCLEAHGVCSKLLTIFFRTCTPPYGTGDNWSKLQELFVTCLVPYSADPESRMRCLLYLWIQAGEDGWAYLHELFVGTRRARLTLSLLLRAKNDEEVAKQFCNEMPSFLLHLKLLLKNVNKRQEFFNKFMTMLSTTPKLKELLWQLLSAKGSCAEKHKISKEIISLWLKSDGTGHLSILEGLLFYVTEVTFDKESMKFLLELIGSCVHGNAISSALDLKRLHVAKASLKLLNEVLYVKPDLGLHIDILKHTIPWSFNSNESLSELAVRCLVTTSSHRKLVDIHPTLSKTNILPQCFKMIQSGSRGQVKMAMKCLSQHFSSTIILHKVFITISSQFDDPSNAEVFKQGVSALGHFAELCPPDLKLKVVELCFSSVILDIIQPFLNQAQTDTSSLDSSNNTWVDWQQLPFHVLIKVQALRTVGRCLRYCGTSGDVSRALEILQNVISTRKDDNAPSDYREVDVAYLRYEASSAILFILEESSFQSLISKQLVLVLSQVLIDPHMEVRSLFARKLCHGLAPHKVWSNIGRKRGKLPPCFLGLLSLLGSNVWMNDGMPRKEAEQLLQEVFFSRRFHQHKMNCVAKAFQGLRSFYEEEPLCVLENIFAIAVPILAENICKFTEEYGGSESLEEVANCFKFTCSTLCHKRTYGGEVQKEYLTRMLNDAKERVILPVNAEQRQKYIVVFQVAEIALKHYHPLRKELLFLSVALPPPFFSVDVGIEEQIVNESILSVTDLKKLESKTYGKKVQQQGHHDEPGDGNYNDSLCSVDDFSAITSGFADQTVEQDSVQWSRSGDIASGNSDDYANISIVSRESRIGPPAFYSTPVTSSGDGKSTKRRRAN